MEDTKAIAKLLQGPGDIIDAIGAQLARFGLDLAPLVLQVFFLVVIAAVAVPVVRGAIPKRGRKKPSTWSWAAVAAIVLLGVGVVIAVVDNATMPDQVTGKVQADKLEDVRVSLLGYTGTQISVDTGTVDTMNGAFALHYSPLVNGRARKLRVGAQGCKPLDGDLARPLLRAGTPIEAAFTCTSR
jgi:hypothetical protein